MSEPTDLNGPGWGQAPRYPGPGGEGDPANAATTGGGLDATPEFVNPGIGPDSVPGVGAPGTGPNPAPANQSWVPLEPNQPPQPQYGQYAPGMPPGAGSAPPPGQAYYPGQPYAGAVPPPALGGYGSGQPYPPGSGPQNYGYAPPPMAAFKPGIIPLRPLALGDIWDGAFKAIRYAPGVMFGLTALIQTVFGVISAVISARAIASSIDFFNELITSTNTLSSSATLTYDLVGGMPRWLISSLIVTGLSYLATTILTGLLTFAVSRAVIGQKVTIGQAWAEVAGQIGRLLLLALTTVLIVVVGVAIPTILIVLVAVSLSAVMTGITALFMVPTMIVLAAFLTVKLTLATPALVLEHATVGQALRRSWHLSKGTFWRLLGIIALTGIVVSAASATVSGGVGAVFGIVSAAPVLAVIVTTIIAIATSTLFTPFQAGVTSLLYIDRRIRTEGLDIELTKAAEG